MNVFKKPLDSERNFQASLYIGNLDSLVDETLLYELFIQLGPVRLLNLPKDRILRKHQGYGFVEFRGVQDADYALEILRGIRLYGRTLKMKKTDHQSNTNALSSAGAGDDAGISIGARLFIKNLNPIVDEKYLKETFKKFGNLIETPQIVRDEEGYSKGHGFVEYDSFESSDEAIERMNGAILMNNKIGVEYAYKEGRAKHGDSVERLLAEKAKTNVKRSTGKPKKAKKTH